MYKQIIISNDVGSVFLIYIYIYIYIYIFYKENSRVPNSVPTEIDPPPLDEFHAIVVVH